MRLADGPGHESSFRDWEALPSRIVVTAEIAYDRGRWHRANQPVDRQPAFVWA